MQNGEVLKIEVNELVIEVTGHIVNSSEIFRIVFSDKRPALVVTESISGSKPFWTSVPQGRQAEAEFFGKLIEEKLKK